MKPVATLLIAAAVPAALAAQQFDPRAAPTRPVTEARPDPRTFPKLPGSDQPVKLRVGPGGKDSFPGPVSGQQVKVKYGAPILLAHYRDDLTKPIKTNVRLESSDDPAFATIKGSALGVVNQFGTVTINAAGKPYGFEPSGVRVLYLRAKTGTMPSNVVAVTTEGSAVIN